MVAVPLMISCLVLAISSTPRTREAGKLSGLSLLTFIIFLMAAGAMTLSVCPWLFRGLVIDDAARASLHSMSVGATDALNRASQSPSVGQWFTTLIPANFFRAVVEENTLAIVVCVILFALAVTRIAPERRALIVRGFEAIAETTRVLISWFLVLMPIAVFALAFSMAAKTGIAIAGSVGYYVLILCAILLAFTILLYPVTALLGRISILEFALGSAPAQAVAIGARSSLAALGPLIDGANDRLQISTRVSGVVLPLSVSTFKLNRVVSAPLQLYFLAHLYGVSLRPGFVVTFILATILFSFTAAGIPSAGESMVSLPLYLAAGIPIEGIIFLKAVDALPDIFKTLLNVTADMSVAVIVNRVVAGPASLSETGQPNLALTECSE